MNKQLSIPLKNFTHKLNTQQNNYPSYTFPSEKHEAHVIDE